MRSLSDVPRIAGETNKCLTSIQPLSYKIFVGMDTAKLNIDMGIYDHKCRLENKVIKNDVDMVVKYFQKKYPGKKIAFVYEAGPTGYGLYDALTKAKYDCLVTSPAMVPKEPAMRVKTNRIDSQKLAETLRGGQIKGIRVPSEAYRHLRNLTHLRDTLVKKYVATKCQIKALLLFENLPYPEAPAGSQWNLSVLNELRTDSRYEKVKFEICEHLDLLEFIHKKILDAQRKIREFCKSEPDIKQSIEYMRSIPGIGEITSSEILARIGDWRNLRNSQEIGAFLGLVPCEHSTGDDIRRGNITRMGHKRARNMLIEASWAAIKKDGELRDFYKSIYSRNPRDRAAKKAIVAVARKLTTRIYAVLKNRRPYEIRKKVIVSKIETIASKEDSKVSRT